MSGASLVGIDLSLAYGGRFVLRGANVAVVPGRVNVLVGPSGAGKTTLLWVLAGLARPATGRVVVTADAARAADEGRPVDRSRARLGMVFQSGALWHHLPAAAHLDLVLRGKGLSASARRGRVEAMLGRLRLGSLAGRRPGELSGGERQRLAIARALVTEPAWLLLDEPLAHLDGPARTDLFEQVRGILCETQAGVLLATHNTSEALRLADDVVVLLGGEVAQSGRAEEVYRRPVGLEAALALGPASSVGREAAWRLLGGLPAWAERGEQVVLRPEDVAFEADASGRACVVGCEFVGGAYRLTVEAEGERVLARHGWAVGPGTVGRVRLAGS